VNYSDLQAQFQSLLNRRDCTSTQAATFLQQAITRIQRELRVPAMEKSVVATIDSTYNGLVIPSDLLELINIVPASVTPDLQERLSKCDLTEALQASALPGKPRLYARQGGVWVLGPSPAAGAQIRIDYYAEVAPLVNPTDTNIFTLIAGDLIVYGALSYAADFYTDKRKATFEGTYGLILSDLQNMADEDEENGGASVQPAYRYSSDDCDW
jgi:hypothetical protein